MVLPRKVVPGRCYLITRRCTQRQFLMRPGPDVNQAVGYCVAEAATRAEVEVLAFVAESNHYHAVVWDPSGNVVDFYEHFHKMLAKVLNVRWSRRENFWAGGGRTTSVVELVEPADTLAKIIYTLANPVKDHLVAHARDWPGVSSWRLTMRGGELRFRRPRWFFSPDGTMPEEARLRLSRPPGFEHLTEAAWAARIEAGVRQEEDRAAAIRAKSGRKVLGRRAIRRQSWKARPSTDAVGHRRLSPRFAAARPEARAAATKDYQRFVSRYRDAMGQVRRGRHDVVFPYGTFRFARLHLVRVEPPPER
ncbi:MAG: hypothetical protein AAGA56_01215 [Myxococcota bacterium]